MEPPQTRYLRRDGVYIAYQVVGNGPVDVAMIFHPTESNVDLMWDEPDWRPFMEGTASFARLILHDRRGLGVSSRNVPPPDLETQVADLLAVLDAAGSQRAILAGGGLSAAVNPLFAATHPERVIGLVWNNPYARAAWARDYPWGMRRREFQARLASGPAWGSFAHARTIALSRAAERLGVAVEDVAAPEITAAQLNGYGRIVRNTASPDVADAIARIEFDTDVRAVLPMVRVPAVLITGTRDTIDEARHLADLMPQATLTVVEGRSGVKAEPTLDALRAMAGVTPVAPELESVLATVLFTDIVNSTAVQARLGDRGWRDLVTEHHATVRAALARWQGNENDTAGDGFFATFDGPARAIRCALEIAARIRELGVEVRAGVHIGECQVVDGKRSGIAVTIGARVAALAAPSQVLVTQTVRDLVAGSGFTFADAGQPELKGVPHRWPLYAVSA